MVHVLRFARHAGFTLAEIKTLFHGFEPRSAPGARWQAMAEAKPRELDALQARIASMRRAIRKGLACGCVRLEDCGLATAPASRQARPRQRCRANRWTTEEEKTKGVGVIICKSP